MLTQIAVRQNIINLKINTCQNEFKYPELVLRPM